MTDWISTLQSLNSDEQVNFFKWRCFALTSWNKLKSTEFCIKIYFYKYQLYCFFQLLVKKLTIYVETLYNKITVRDGLAVYSIDMNIFTTSSKFFTNIFCNKKSTFNRTDDTSVPVEKSNFKKNRGLRRCLPPAVSSYRILTLCLGKFLSISYLFKMESSKPL
jgi:hypothetical protein